MKKKLLKLFVLAAVSSGISAEDFKFSVKTSAGTFGYNSKVEYEYDSFGNVLSSVFSEDSRMDYSYIYDDEGRIVAFKFVYRNEGFVSEDMYTYEYDSKGNKVCEKSNFHKVFFEYDGNGNNVSASEYDLSGSLTGKVFCVYDRNNRAVSRVSELGGSKVEEFFKYDSRKNSVTKTVQNYSVQKKGKGEKVKTVYKKSGKPFIFYYEYDEAGNEVHYRNSTEEVWNEYDSHGNLVYRKLVQKDSGQEFVSEYKYEYDRNNNEIREICCDSDSRLMYDVHFYYEYVNVNGKDLVKIKYEQ